MAELTGHPVGLAALAIFIVAYLAVIAEERLHLRKSIPVLLGAGAIWALIGLVGATIDPEAAGEAVRHNILEYAELFLFLIVAMTFVNTLEERGLFAAIRAYLIGRGLSYRALFWVTGALAFVISPIADNLTTALLMGAVCVALGTGRPTFVVLACVNVVVAANAGGAFSPFGDITTLMVWQHGAVPFGGFFALFLPSLVNWLVPAAIMSLAVGAGRPPANREEVDLQEGAIAIAGLFLATIAITVTFHSALHLPPALGMMFGLGLLNLFSYVFNRVGGARFAVDEPEDVFAHPVTARVKLDQRAEAAARDAMRRVRRGRPVQVFRSLERVEWDTLMFFYGVILCVGGLGSLGYLALVSRGLYGGLGDTTANILIGILSAIIDNVPVMFAVLSMDLTLSRGQWLLVTLTAGVGGSLLSIGSAAGVALMGQARGIYTFLAHLRWSWAIALGYAASVLTHLLLNRHLF